MKIGQVAKHAGVSIDTVRFYERRGVLPAPDRTPSGYRTYKESTVNASGSPEHYNTSGSPSTKPSMPCTATTPAPRHANQSSGECRPSSTASTPRSPNCRQPAGMSAKRWLPAGKDIAGSPPPPYSHPQPNNTNDDGRSS